ncbi:hypothetical protein CR513_10733, partial [Mucuna pruriens]
MLNLERCILKSKSLPSFLCGEIVSTTAYILNRSPTRRVEDKTPKEAWTGAKPNVTHLRIFGLVCYKHVPNQPRRVLDDKGTPYILIGYHSTKGYKLYELENSQVSTSKEVIYDENGSWNRNATSKEEFSATPIVNKDRAPIVRRIIIRLVGKLLYLTTTRSGISYSVRKFSIKPMMCHFQAATRVLKYFKLPSTFVDLIRHVVKIPGSHLLVIMSLLDRPMCLGNLKSKAPFLDPPLKLKQPTIVFCDNEYTIYLIGKKNKALKKPIRHHQCGNNTSISSLNLYLHLHFIKSFSSWAYLIPPTCER